MGADIVNIVDGKFSGMSFIHLPYGDWADLRAEIVRLRGEVFRIAGGDTECCPSPTTENALDCLRDLRQRYDEAIAPAMPNGVEEMVAYLDNWLSREHGLNLGRVKVGGAVDAALRAADNRDAAGVDSGEDAYVIERMGKLLAEIAVIVNGPEPDMTRWSYHDLPEKVRALKATPAAVPAGEAVAPDELADHLFRALTSLLPTVYGKLPRLRSDLRMLVGSMKQLYTTQPAPVQAAPQEGCPFCGGTGGHWEGCRAPVDTTAHPSACELGADGVGLIAAERKRQITAEGWSPEHDDQHDDHQLSQAAACYALGVPAAVNDTGSRVWLWPWELEWWKPTDRMRDLAKAGALIAAEIDRLQRAALQHRGDSRGGEGL